LPGNRSYLSRRLSRAQRGTAFPPSWRKKEKPFRVGIASLINPRSASQFAAFEERLRQLLSTAGHELAIDFMVLDGDAERYPVLMRARIDDGKARPSSDGLLVDHEVEFGGFLDGQISSVSSFQNAIDVGGWRPARELV
jgi:hypothetical protein